MSHLILNAGRPPNTVKRAFLLHFHQFFTCFLLFLLFFLFPNAIHPVSLHLRSKSLPIRTVTIKPSPNTPNSTHLSPYSSTALYANWTTTDCPCRLCGPAPITFHRQIVCDTPPLTNLPIYKIPPHIERIEITGTPTLQNNLTLGPLFYRFPELKALRLTYSNVPAIGQATFRYKTSLTALDLSHNVIGNLIDASFRGLRLLETLNLSYNHLSDLTSAPFQHLISLRHLNLSHNHLASITTRLFYNLTVLETLDLSGNPLGEITPQNTLDLRPLRHLYMSHCRLTALHSLFYRNVPNLELLDLRWNRLESLHKNEFRHLPNLTQLFLDGNRFVVLPSAVFTGNSLQKLGLSSNALVQLHSEAFVNCTVEELDLSDNNFTTFDPNTFYPLSTTLTVLRLSNIPFLTEPSISITKLLAPLTALQQISLSNLSLDAPTLSTSLFSNTRSTLTLVNLSGNALNELNAKVIEGMTSLETLDISGNALFELDSDLLFSLSTFPNLTTVYFDRNPWSCFRCHLLYFRNWITSSSSDDDAEKAPSASPNAYQNACQKEGRCAVCAFPANLEGAYLHDLEEWQLEWCTDPTVQLRVSTTEPNVGLVLAILIIVILMIVIIAVIIYYRNRGAIYITNEDLLYSGRSPSAGGGPWASTDGGRGSGETDQLGDKSAGSTAFTVSSRIRQFVNATQSPPDSAGHSSGSEASLDRPGMARKPNGYANGGHEPILKSIINGNHRDSTNTTESILSNGYSKTSGKTATILRRPKKVSSSVSTTSSRGVRTVSLDEDPASGGSGDGPGSGSHYERLPTSKYRILKGKSSSRSEDEDEEEEVGHPAKKVTIRAKPVPPPRPPSVPRGAKPAIPPKKVSLGGTSATSRASSSKVRTPSKISISSDSSDSETETESESAHDQPAPVAGVSRPVSLPSALRPYADDESARSSAEVEDVEDFEDFEEEDDDDGEPSTTAQRLPLERRGDDSSPDSSTQALAEGVSTSPSSTKSSDFNTRSRSVND